jgi:hypothetical protein
MKKFWLVGIALATVLATAPGASADTKSFWFTVTGASSGSPNGQPGNGTTNLFGLNSTGITGGGILTGTQIGNSSNYAITSGIDIWINGEQGTFVPTNNPPGTPTTIAGAYVYDDIFNLTASPDYVDLHGLMLQFGDWIVNINLDEGADVFGTYNTVTTDWNPADTDGYDINMEAGIQTPEPSSWLLLGTGLFLMAGFLFWKAKPKMLMASTNRAA